MSGAWPGCRVLGPREVLNNGGKPNRGRMPQRLQVLQDALTGENAPFRWMIEHLRDVVVLLRADGTVAYLSPSYEATLGRCPMDLVGRHALELVHPDDREAAAEGLAAVLAEPGVSRTVEYRHEHADGSWRCFEATGTLLPLEGMGECILVVARDVTEERQGHQARSLLETLAQCSEDVIVTTDTAGVITTWNPAAERVLGFSAREAVGSRSEGHVPPEEWPRTMALAQAVMDGGALRNLETERFHKDGSRIPLSMTAFPLRDEDGALLGIGSIARDLRDRRKADEALEANATMRAIFRRTLRGDVRGARPMRETGRRLAGEVDAASMEGFLVAFAEMGLGELRLVESRGDRHVVSGSDLLEHRTPASQPTCSLPLGYLETAAGRLTGHAGLGAELECQSLGHERCLFVVRARREA